MRVPHAGKAAKRSAPPSIVVVDVGVAAQREDGNVATGADATALLLEALRPDAVAAATWTQLAAAAARGLGRWSPPR